MLNLFFSFATPTLFFSVFLFFRTLKGLHFMFDFLLLLSFDDGNNGMLLSVFVDDCSNDLTSSNFSFTSSQILSSSSMRNERLLISFKISLQICPANLGGLELSGISSRMSGTCTLKSSYIKHSLWSL